jgi:hypothetical protein
MADAATVAFLAFQQINEDPETYAEAVLVKHDFSKAFDVY